MERARDRELDDHPRLELRLRDLRHLIDRGDRAGDGVVAVAQKVGHLDGLAAGLLRRGRAHLLHFIRAESNHGRHPGRRRVRGSLHRLPAQLHELHAVLERHRARERERGVFAERQTGADVDGVDERGALLGGLHLLQRRERRDVDGGLGHLRGVELIRGSVDADVEEVVSEDRGRVVEELRRRGALLAELLRHADGLRALTGEEERVLRLQVCGLRRRGDDGDARHRAGLTRPDAARGGLARDRRERRGSHRRHGCRTRLGGVRAARAVRVCRVAR
mmetsp:Transcript_10456/g.37900  ORF Transcript_10456/g.37900 Transcript_10456/m.37900 type:complete len:277 (+) Transcript_10456:393-1223(+)